jgi:hypothetical protein
VSATADRGRQRCYDAEDSAFGGTHLDQPISWADLIALVGAVTSDWWWHRLGVAAPVVVPARREATRSSADGTTVRIAEGGRTALTVLHELTHHLVIHRQLPDPGHGAHFRAVELRVAEVVGGAIARRQLATSFAEHGLAVPPWDGPEPYHPIGLASSLATAGPGRLRGAIPLPPASSQPRVGGE